MTSFSSRLIAWQRQHGRHGLPWQGADAYRVWLSEVMLQQTQVTTVIPYFQRFIASFPDVATLARASVDDVLAHWSGLGYYARGRNLHRAAQLIMQRHDGLFPENIQFIQDLPGVGRSTAAAVCALAFHQRHAILDGNVKRVLARWHGVDGWTGDKKVEAKLWQLAGSLLPEQQSSSKTSNQVKQHSDIAIYTQALMDMGATVCTRSKPACGQCPVNADCMALNSRRVAELPTPRPRKRVPEKHATFLLLLHGNDILLEKRPPSGIWGGLWCPPQIDDGTGVVEDYLKRNGFQVRERIEQPEFSHTFTHFKLHLTPVLLQLSGKPQQVQQAGGRWLEVEVAPRAGIPTPVRKMLLQLSGG